MTVDLSMTLTEYASAVRSGNVSCEEYVAATLDQIARHDARLHAYVSVYGAAQEKAKKIDDAVRNGRDIGALAGAPFGIKDNICVADSRTTCCSWMLEEYVSPYDATVMSRLHAADAITVGKTNMDEFAMGLTTEFAAFGPSRNPWDTDCVPGGSSGGSAVAVSALECIAALGSDTGGSVRNPASFCSVVGFKPTYGGLSRHGLVSYANSIEQVGVMTRSVPDVALVMNVMSGTDRMDDTTLRAKECDYAADMDSGVDGLCIGLDVNSIDESSAVGKSTRRAADALSGLGAKIIDVKLEHAEAAVSAYYVITAAEAGSNLARYDNLRYGYPMPTEGYEYNAYISRARRRLGPEVTRRMILGGFVPSAGHAGKYYLKALKAQNALAGYVDEAFSSDNLACMLCPTVPVLPFRFGEKIDDPVELFRMDTNTVMANLTYRPSISVPFASHDGLPIGMQLTGISSADGKLLGIANALHACTETSEVPEL